MQAFRTPDSDLHQCTHLRAVQRILEPNSGAAVRHCVPDQLTDNTDSPDQALTRAA